MPPLPDSISELQQQVDRLGFAASFPWHTQQLFALRAATDVVMVIGGNRSGKTETGRGAVARLLAREGPIYQRLRKPKGRRLELWVAPTTDEKAKTLFEPRLLDVFKRSGLDYRYVASPHRIFTWKDEDGGGTLIIKSQEQGFLSFESNDVDFVWLDEEPEDPRIFTSSQTRLATTNGVIMLTFTPLKGMSWTRGGLYNVCADQLEYEIADRVWRKGNEITVIKAGMADNPEAVAGGGVARLQANMAMSEAEKDSRLYGNYGFVEGTLLPKLAAIDLDKDSLYVLDRLPANRAYHWILTADPNKRHGALLLAFDPFGNEYVCAEHYAENLADTIHAQGYDAMLAQFRLKRDDVQVFADPGGAGAQALFNLAEVGFAGTAVPKDAGSVAASIKRLRRASYIDPRHPHPVTGKLGAPHIYFLRTLESTWQEAGRPVRGCRLLWELGQYRQAEHKAPDTPVKKNDDLVDCLRYGELVRMFGPEPEDYDPDADKKRLLDTTSRHAHDDFDELAKRVERKGGGAGISMFFQ